MNKVKLENLVLKNLSGEWGDELNENEDGVRVIRTADFNNDGTINYSKIVKRKIKQEKIDEKKLIYGDIIVEKSGGTDKNPVGRVVFFDVNEICLANNFTQVLRLKNDVDAKYVFYNLFYNYKNGSTMQMFNKTTGIQNLKMQQYLNQKINLIDLEEQKKVVYKLDKIKNIIEIRKEQIEKLEQLVKSQFVEMFENNEWNEVNLNDVSQKITDGEHGTVPRVEKGRLYLMARNITDSSKIDLTEISYIPEENHKKIYSRCNPEKDDLLLVCVGATVGKVALVPEMEEFSMARSVALIKPNKQLMNSSFLLYLMKSDYIQSQIKNCVHAAAQAGLYTNMIKDLKFKLPPIELQNQFSEFVKLIDKQKFEIEKSLNEMEELYDSLMEEYFG